jgi:hypothetical protein
MNGPSASQALPKSRITAYRDNMKLNGRTIIDDDIAIDVRKAVDAFERFKETRRARRRTEGGGDPAFDLDKAIRSRLEFF